MKAAHADEVVQIRRPAIGPVPAVVPLPMPGVGAPRPLTVLVATLHRTAQRRRNHPGLPADVQRFTGTGLDEAHDGRITGHAPYGLLCHYRPVFHMRRIGRIHQAVFDQRFRGSVHHHLIAVRRAQPLFRRGRSR